MTGKVFTVLMIALIACAGVSYAAGIGTLLEVGKNMGEIAKAQDAETAAYRRVKQAVANGSLVTGVSRNEVFASYGEPVIMNTHTGTSREKWVYMPATSDAFKGEKIYLYFVGETLDEIEMRE